MASHGVAGTEPHASEGTITELRSALEELPVAGEALNAQQSELVATRELVEVERRRHMELFTLAPVAQLVTDAFGIVREASIAAAELLGVHPRFLGGKALALFVSAEDRREFGAGLATLASAPDLQHWPVRMEGGAVPFSAEVTVSPIRDPAGDVLAVRWVIADVSDRERTERDLRATNERLEGALREASALSQQLQHALDSRVVIEQAKGRLMEGLAVTADEAFELLRRRARDTGRKLREVASDVVDGTIRLPGEGPPPAPSRELGRNGRSRTADSRPT